MSISNDIDVSVGEADEHAVEAKPHLGRYTVQ
jgi:hypothetical protein